MEVALLQRQSSSTTVQAWARAESRTMSPIDSVERPVPRIQNYHIRCLVNSGHTIYPYHPY